MALSAKSYHCLLFIDLGGGTKGGGTKGGGTKGGGTKGGILVKKWEFKSIEIMR